MRLIVNIPRLYRTTSGIGLVQKEGLVGQQVAVVVHVDALVGRVVAQTGHSFGHLLQLQRQRVGFLARGRVESVEHFLAVDFHVAGGVQNTTHHEGVGGGLLEQPRLPRLRDIEGLVLLVPLQPAHHQVAVVPHGGVDDPQSSLVSLQVYVAAGAAVVVAVGELVVVTDAGTRKLHPLDGAALQIVATDVGGSVAVVVQRVAVQDAAGTLGAVGVGVRRSDRVVPVSRRGHEVVVGLVHSQGVGPLVSAHQGQNPVAARLLLAVQLGLFAPRTRGVALAVGADFGHDRLADVGDQTFETVTVLACGARGRRCDEQAILCCWRNIVLEKYLFS